MTPALLQNPAASTDLFIDMFEWKPAYILERSLARLVDYTKVHFAHAEKLTQVRHETG